MVILDSGGRKIITLILGGILLLSFLLLAIIVPKIEITLHVQERLLKKEYELTLDPSITATLIPLDILPLYPLSLPQSLQQEKFISVKKMNGQLKEEDLLGFLKAKIDQEIMEGDRISDGEITYTLKIKDANARRVTARVEAKISHEFDIDEINARIRGKPIEHARLYFEKLPYIQHVEFNAMPKWLFFVPFLKERIIISEQ